MVSANSNSSSPALARRAPRPCLFQSPAWPATAFARLDLAWAHRDRLLQADRLIEHEAGSIGPEPGTTTTVRVYHANSNALLHTASGLAGTAFTHDLDLVNDATIRIEVEAQRDALVSRQTHIRIIACECGEKLANASFDTQAAWTLGAACQRRSVHGGPVGGPGHRGLPDRTI